MSYHATKFVLRLRNLTPTEKAVAHSLAYHAHKDGTESYPSMQTIADEAGIKHRQAAQRIVVRLEEKGVIVPTTEKKGGRSAATHYRLNMQKRNLTVAVSQGQNCNPTVAVSDSENCNSDRCETATLETENCNSPVARKVRVKEVVKNAGAATEFLSEAEGKEFLSVWKYFLQAFDKEEKLSSAYKKQGLAILRRHKELGHDPVRNMASVIDLAAKKVNEGKAFFSQWHAIFGKEDTYRSLLEEYQNTECVPEAATIEA